MLVLYVPVEGAVVVEDPGAQRTVEQGPGPEHHRYWFIWQTKYLLFLFVIRIVHFLLFMYQLNVGFLDKFPIRIICFNFGL